MEVEENIINEKTDTVQISLSVKPPVISPDIPVLKECCKKSESHREVDFVPCYMCTNVNTAPMIDCKILNKNKSGCIDTAAVITVIPRTRDLPIAKLRLKGVTSHKASLYGPAMTEFEIGGRIFKHETYEADIQEHILGIDFLHKFDAVIGVKKQVLKIGEGPNRVEIPFTLGETKNANIYTTDRVAYTVRAESSFTLRPFVEREVATVLRTDTVTDESVRGRTDACQSSGHTQGLDLGEGDHTQSRVVLSTQVVDQAVSSDSEGDKAKGSLKENSQLPGETKLGLFISNPAFGNKVSKLPPGVVAQSGILPCLTAPISVTIQNLGDKCVTIPKYAVLGEVFILHPDKYEREFDEDFEKEGEYDEGEETEMNKDTDEIAQVNVVNHDTTPFSDAEINAIPSLPEIKEGEPLPKDLQELVDRCTQLSATEKQELTKVLRKHHDIFAKDNTTFGKCPWIKFRIDTAPGAFQYITDRVITPAKDKTPENDLDTSCEINCANCLFEERKLMKLSIDNINVNWTKVVPDGMSPIDIRKAQLLDPDIMPIMIAVQDQRKPEFQEIAENSNKTRELWFQFNSLVLEGGVLYRKFEHPSGLKEKEELQLILPSKLVKTTVKTYHEQLGVGNHFGVTKTLAYLKRFFWWPGMFEDTYEIVSQCKICAKYKGPKQHTKIPLKLFQEGVLHGRWHVDICGPINPKSKEGHEYILVAVEAFSGWPVVVPLYKQTADEIAQALITHVFSIFGAPQSLLTDQGKAFDSTLFQEIMELYQIKKLRTTAFHPATNGKAERWIKTLKQHLMMLVEQDRDNWPKYLPFIAQAYRNLPHSSHKFSPYEVMFGAAMRSPLDADRGSPPKNMDMHKLYPMWVRKTMQDIHEVVANMNKKAPKRMKAY
ncbi:Retrovirus-related Pol polyprotein from transposon 412 [Frankliniella fusca]|uniref:RNA-directed DNA polymerase n=1 Tax=Frankliniella fusca TaxID=407009 RepID=A0AAE1HQ27_9NEOP|nr:Retrovirus-related Pol polyprotein from transposon 412 [Frankliniella fusca]